MVNVRYWCDIYERFKNGALCLDIEVVYYEGPISVIGVYTLKDGEVDYRPYIKGQNLTLENLKKEFSNCKMLITFNGLHFDVPKIRQEFPGAIPDDIIVLDLYLLAKALNFNANLKVLENTFNIERFDAYTKNKGIGAKLWWRYDSLGDKNAFDMLIKYNREDAMNLYFIAESLMKEARK